MYTAGRGDIEVAVLATVVTVRRGHGAPVRRLCHRQPQVAAQTQNTCIATSLAQNRPCRQKRKVRCKKCTEMGLNIVVKRNLAFGLWKCFMLL